MAKRMILMIAAIAVFVGGVAFIKVRQVQAAIAQNSSFQPPPDAVTTTIAKGEAWRSTLTAIGTVAPVQGVMLSADLPGVVESIEFKSGGGVENRDVLVRLDARQERAQLLAAEAKRDLARMNRDRVRGLLETK